MSAEKQNYYKPDQSAKYIQQQEVQEPEFRANKSWDSRWAATDPESVPYGKTIFLMGDEYDPNIILREGGDYQVIFNDLTGHYIFRKKE